MLFLIRISCSKGTGRKLDLIEFSEPINCKSAGRAAAVVTCEELDRDTGRIIQGEMITPVLGYVGHFGGTGDVSDAVGFTTVGSPEKQRLNPFMSTYFPVQSQAHPCPGPHR